MTLLIINKFESGESESKSCVAKTEDKTNALNTLPILHNINKILN